MTGKQSLNSFSFIYLEIFEVNSILARRRIAHFAIDCSTRTIGVIELGTRNFYFFAGFLSGKAFV